MSRMGKNPLQALGFDAEKEREDLGIELPKVRVGKPRQEDRPRTKGVQAGLPDDWTRATFIVRCEYLNKLKDYAYTERITLKEAMDSALEEFLIDKGDLLQHK